MSSQFPLNHFIAFLKRQKEWNPYPSVFCYVFLQTAPTKPLIK
jgi:hypothetical protein